MKIIIALCFLFAASFTQAAATWTQGPTQLWRYQCDPTFAADGSVTSATMQGFFGYTLTDPDGQTQFFQAGSVSFDPIALATTTVTADGITVTLKQLFDLKMQSCLDQWNAQQAVAAKAQAAKAAKLKIPAPAPAAAASTTTGK